MMPGAKHLDPVLGVDIHIILIPTPGGPVPTPLPHPFIGMILDPMDYVPIIGSTVLVNGSHRGQAGTAGKCLPPHIPMGGPFQKPPGNESENFLGSATVLVDGEPFTHLVHPALTCNDIGMPPPPRAKKKSKTKSLVLPTSVVMAVPMGPPVMVGGPPTISLMAMGMKLAMAGLGKAFKKIKKLKGKKGKAKKGKGKKGDSPSTNKAACEGEHPIDCLTGAVVDDYTDITLGSERLPLRFIRHYRSSWAARDAAPGDSPIGRGFRHSYMRTLERTADGFALVTPTGDRVELPPIDPESGDSVWSGYRLTEIANERGKWARVERRGEPTMEFDMARPGAAPLRRLRHDGNWCELTYDSGGRLSRIGFSWGLKVDVEHDKSGRIAALVETKGEQRRALSRYEYSQAGELVRRIDAAGASEQYEYNAQHFMTRQVDRVGYGINYEYDDAGRCRKTAGDDGLYAAEYTYHPEAGITIRKFPNGGEWVYMADENGVGIGIIDPYGGKRTFEVDEDGRVVKDIDPGGEATELVYDDWGKHTHRVNPLGFEQPPADVDPNPPDCLPLILPNTPIEWRWGTLLAPSRIRPGKPIPVRAGLAPTPDDSYTGSPKEPQKRYDAMGRLVHEVDDLGAERSWSRDANGNVTSFTDADGSTVRTEYHSWNLPRREIDPLGGATLLEHNFHEELTKVTDPGGTVSEFVYDHKDRLIEVSRAGQVKERYKYDAAGNLILKTDGHGKELASYSIGKGNLASEIRFANGEVHKFEYGPLGRFKKAVLEDTQGKIVCEFDIDEANRTHKDVRDGEGVEHAWAYDKICATTVLGAFTTEFEFDPSCYGFITDPTGADHTIFWSAGGGLVRELASGTAELSVYDKSGRCVETARRKANGDVARTRYRYSREGDLLAIIGEDGWERRFEYDKMHRLIRETREDGTVEHYDHDRAGNIVKAPGLEGAAIAPGNRLSSANGESISYNLRQNIASRIGAGVKTRYSYDSRDQIVRIDRTARDGELPVWTARYDPLGRRISKTLGEGDAAQTTRFVWDEHRLAAEIAPDGRLRIYIYASAGAMSPCMFVDYDGVKADPASGRVHHIFTDHLGTPVEVEDASGEVVWRARISPFGACEVDRSSTIELNLRWPGHYFDPETGLHYNRFRYYDPSICRYIQTDPIGLAGGHNTYAYASSPLRHVDLVGWAHRTNKAGTDGASNKAKGADAEAPSARIGDPASATQAVARKAGMDTAQLRNLQKHCKDNNRLMVMRAGNEAQIPHIKNPGMSPKPVDCKLNTAKSGPNKGLVTTGQGHKVDPDSGKKTSKWKSKDEGGAGYSDEYGKMKEKGWKADDGVIKDPSGKPVHGDYDMQGVYDKNPNGSYGPPKDPSGKPYDGGTNNKDFQKDINKDLNADPYGGPKDKNMVQHGANDDFKKADGSAGRTPEPDESYLVVEPDGNSKIINGTDNLHDYYDQNNIPWPY